VAQYGKSAPSKAVCPQHSSTPGQQELPPNVTCLWPNALQVSTISVVQTFVDRCHVNSCFTLKTLSEEQSATMMDSKKGIPKVSYRALKARGKILAQGVCYSINKIPKFILKRKRRKCTKY
jgi:hypothetical protein